MKTEMHMEKILSGQVLVNGTDIWKGYGVFLTEEHKGGMENLTAILTPSKAKKETAVNLREEDGEKYSAVLTPRNEARDVELHFALYAGTKAEWLRRYLDFIRFLKQGDNGWLDVGFPALGLTLRMRYSDGGRFRPLVCLWSDGLPTYAGRFKVKFREPVPII